MKMPFITRQITRLSKNALLALSTRDFPLPLLLPGIRRILMYHRFSKAPDPMGAKMDAPTFEWQLQRLKHGWNVIPLGALFRVLRTGRKLNPKTAVITVDDGYLDFYQIAYPLLKRYGLPATFFPTIQFVEGRTWLWPDMLDYILRHCQRMDLVATFGRCRFDLQVDTPAARARSWQQLSDFCSDLPDQEKWEFISYLSTIADVRLPDKPSAAYAAANYDQILEMSRNGIEIGAHTLRHPILSRLDPATLRKELCEPKRILEARLGMAVASLAYPSGRDIDINPLVVTEARKCGYLGAVVTRRRFDDHHDGDGFQMPRMGVGPDKAEFCWKLQGVELAAEAARYYLKL